MKKLNLKECTILESSNTVFVDVDDTLVLWGDHNHLNKSDRLIDIPDPHLKGEFVTLLPHITHINIVKRNHAQGRTVIVWSAAGHEWAETVVKALGLEKYVSLIMGKPILYLDDREMYDWGCMRTYLSKDVEGDK